LFRLLAETTGYQRRRLVAYSRCIEILSRDTELLPR
jgi:hypothetical protein